MGGAGGAEALAEDLGAELEIDTIGLERRTLFHNVFIIWEV
jgi:hypothetical protein